MNIELTLLSASLFAWGLGEGMFFNFQPLYLQELGADTLTIALVFSLFGFAMLITHIPAGYLADRLGRKPLLVAAWTSGLLAAWVMALARTLPVFVVGMLLYGLTAFVSSPLNSYITAARGKLSLARGMTLITAAYNLGAVFGPISGGWIGERLGLRSVYLVSACIFILSTVLLLFLRPQPREIHNPAATPEKLRKNKRFVSFLGIIFLAIFVMYLPQPLTPTFLQNERGLSLQNIGLLGSIGSLGNTLLALLLGQFAARTGFLLAQVSVAAFSLLLWKGAGLPWYALGFLLLGGYRSARSLVCCAAGGRWGTPRGTGPLCCRCRWCWQGSRRTPGSRSFSTKGLTVGGHPRSSSCRSRTDQALLLTAGWRRSERPATRRAKSPTS